MAGDMHRERVVRLSLRVGEGGIVRAELLRDSSKAEPMPRTAAAAGGSSTNGVFPASRALAASDEGQIVPEKKQRTSWPMVDIRLSDAGGSGSVAGEDGKSTSTSHRAAVCHAGPAPAQLRQLGQPSEADGEGPPQSPYLRAPVEVSQLRAMITEHDHLISDLRESQQAIEFELSQVRAAVIPPSPSPGSAMADLDQPLVALESEERPRPRGKRPREGEEGESSPPARPRCGGAPAARSFI